MDFPFGSPFRSRHVGFSLLDHPALALLNKIRHHLHVLARQLADLLHRLGRFHMRSQQQPEGLLQGVQPLRRKPLPRKPDLVNPERLVLPPRRSQRIRQHILRHDRPAPDKRVLPHRAELVHRRERAQADVIFDRHMSGQRGTIRQDAVIAHVAVVRNVHIRHQQVVRPDRRDPAAARSPPADRHAFPDRVLIADHSLGRLAVVLQILRGHPDRAERIKRVPRPDPDSPVHHHVRNQPALFAQRYLRSNGAVRPDCARIRNHGSGRNDRAGMDAHSVPVTAAAEVESPSEPALRPGFLGTTWQVRVASHASLPSTKALPSIRPARGRNDSTSTSIRNWSPGVTGRRNFARSIPVNTTSLCSRSGVSLMMMMPPACAIASTTNTPGMIGYPGKCPWKNGSLMVTFLMATSRLVGSNSMILSISKNGYR